jgi:prepilin-type N-terminal cleavage/methylation domain-containing protein
VVPERIRRVVASAGFTLAELVVVTAIFGILAAVSVPTLSTVLRTASLRAGAEEVVAILNGARYLAIRTSTTVCVSNDGTQAQYRVGRCDGPAWTGGGTDANGNFQLANHLRVGGTNNLCFNALGAGTTSPAPCGANGTLTVTDRAGGARLSVIMATTGRLRVQ